MVSKKWTQEREFQTRCRHVPLFSYLDHDLRLPNMAPVSLLHCLVFLLTCFDFWSKGKSTERISSTDWLPEDGEGMAVTETEQVSNQEALSNFWRVVLPWFRHGSCSCKAQDCCFLKVVWISLLAVCCALFSGHLINSGVKHLPEGIEGTRMEKGVWILSIWDSHIEGAEGTAVTETELVSNQEALSNFWRVVLPWFRHGSCSCKAQDCCFLKLV